MVKENLRTKTLRLPNNERIQYTYFNQAMLRITIKRQLNSKNSATIIISHVAQCALFGTLHRKEAERNILATFCRNI